MLTADDKRSLIRLRWNWGSRYEISFADGTWTATRIGGPSVILAAPAARDLLDLIRADYAKVAAGRLRGDAGGSL